MEVLPQNHSNNVKDPPVHETIKDEPHHLYMIDTGPVCTNQGVLSPIRKRATQETYVIHHLPGSAFRRTSPQKMSQQGGSPNGQGSANRPNSGGKYATVGSERLQKPQLPPKALFPKDSQAPKAGKIVKLKPLTQELLEKSPPITSKGSPFKKSDETSVYHSVMALLSLCAGYLPQIPQELTDHHFIVSTPTVLSLVEDNLEEISFFLNNNVGQLIAEGNYNGENIAAALKHTEEYLKMTTDKSEHGQKLISEAMKVIDLYFSQQGQQNFVNNEQQVAKTSKEQIFQTPGTEGLNTAFAYEQREDENSGKEEDKLNFSFGKRGADEQMVADDRKGEQYLHTDENLDLPKDSLEDEQGQHVDTGEHFQEYVDMKVKDLNQRSSLNHDDQEVPTPQFPLDRKRGTPFTKKQSPGDVITSKASTDSVKKQAIQIIKASLTPGSLQRINSSPFKSEAKKPTIGVFSPEKTYSSYAKKKASQRTKP